MFEDEKTKHLQILMALKLSAKTLQPNVYFFLYLTVSLTLFVACFNAKLALSWKKKTLKHGRRPQQTRNVNKCWFFFSCKIQAQSRLEKNLQHGFCKAFFFMKLWVEKKAERVLKEKKLDQQNIFISALKVVKRTV